MSLKELQKSIKSLLSSKSYAETVDLCNEGLKKFPNDISLLLALASAYYGVKEYGEVCFNCEKALKIDPKNIAAFNGILNACQKLKKYSEYSVVLNRLLDVLIEQSNPKAYWEEIEKALAFYKSHQKVQEPICLLERILENSVVSKFIFQSDWKEKPKKLNILKELEHAFEQKEKPSCSIKIASKTSISPAKEPEKTICIENSKLSDLYSKIIEELEQEKSSMAKIKIVGYKLKLINRLYLMLQSETLGAKIKNHSVVELKKMLPDIPNLSRIYPYDEIYFDFYLDSLNVNFCNFQKIFEDFYPNSKSFIDETSKNNSLIANCYKIHYLIQTYRYEAALNLLQNTKSSLNTKSNLYKISTDCISDIIFILEGEIYFHLELFQESFDILFPMKEKIAKLDDQNLNLMLSDYLMKKNNLKRPFNLYRIPKMLLFFWRKAGRCF